MSEHFLELTNVSMTFGEHEVLKDINLYIDKNEFVTLLGPSGCGKTTLLRLVGGFLEPTAGDILFEGKSIIDVPVHKREFNTVFQNYALFPHMNVEENIAFGPNVKKKDKNVKNRVNEMLSLVRLEGFNKRNVCTLSGGQQQRVALARALVNEPSILLLDESLSALDLKCRREMQLELKRIQAETGVTFIFVTHDQEEALTMSDTIVVMNGGIIQQIGTPADVYNEPKNAFVADFIGESNIIDGTMIEDYNVNLLGADFKCVDKDFGKMSPVDVVIRPEDVILKEAGTGIVDGIVKNIIFKGVYHKVVLDINGTEFVANSNDSYLAGTKLGVYIAPNDIQIMNKPQSKEAEVIETDA